MSERPRFLFITCQVGAQQAVKGEMARRWPGFQFAFSRPGFLTFKLPDDCRVPPDFMLGRRFRPGVWFLVGPGDGRRPGRAGSRRVDDVCRASLGSHPRVGA